MKHHIIGRAAITLLVVSVLCLSQAAVAWAGGGNSANAKLCQKNGWQTLLRSDGSSFANQSACVSYAAQGGTLVQESQSQIDCQALGGTFSTDPATDFDGSEGGTFVWSCNNGPFQGFSSGLGFPDCYNAAGGSSAMRFSLSAPWDSTCVGI